MAARKNPGKTGKPADQPLEQPEIAPSLPETVVEPDEVADLNAKAADLRRLLAETEARLTELGAPPPEPVADRDKAAALLAQIGDWQAQAAQIAAYAAHEIAEINDRTESAIAAITKDIDTAELRLEVWADANRHLFKGKKTLKLSTGSIGWKSTAVGVEVTDEAALLGCLENTGHKPVFTLTSTRIDKPALAKRPEIAGKLQGVRLVDPVERFTVAPLVKSPITTGAS